MLEVAGPLDSLEFPVYERDVYGLVSDNAAAQGRSFEYEATRVDCRWVVQVVGS